MALLLMSGCTPTLHPVKSKKVYVENEKKIQKKHQTLSKKKTTVTKKKISSDKELEKSVKKIKKQKLFQSVTKKQAVLLQQGKSKEHCCICGMNLVKYYKTNHAAKLDGKNVQYCSLHCLAEHIKEGAELENPMVVDVKTLKFIPVTEAFYVVGSDVKGTMSPVSKYAFKSLKDAKVFQKKHGGKILDFYSAWQEAKKDFKK